MPTPTLRLCHVDELPEGASRGFDPQRQGQDSLLIVKRGGRLFAYADACPHHGTPMAWRKDAYLDAGGAHIVCAAHGALFDIETGVCTLGPCLGDRLTPIAFTVNDRGEVHLAHHDPQETVP